MAKLDKEDAEVIAEAFRRGGGFSGGGGSSGSSGGSGSSSKSKQTLSLEELARFQKQLATLRKDSVFLGTSFKSQADYLRRFNDELKDSITQKEFELKLAKKAGETTKEKILNDEISAKKEILKKSAVDQRAAAEAAAIAAFTKGLTTLGGSALTKFSSGLSGIQSGAGAIQSGTGLLTSAIDLASEAGSAAGKGLQGVGTIAMAGGPKLKALGAAASVAGMMLDTLSSGAGKAAKFAVEFLGKQLEQVREGFQSMSASGAVFSNGMTGMIDAAHGAGLTIQQFGKVVKENAKDLAASGLSTAGAAEKMGQVTTQINNSKIGPSLQKLGFSFEEQAGLVAEVMGQMNKYGNGRMMSDAKLAQETEKYAKDLRLISGITGEEAKAKMAQAKEAANTLAFNNKLAEMDTAQAENIKRAMSGMNKQQQKDFMEMQIFGTVVNKTGAIMMATNQGHADSVREFSAAADDGALDLRKTVQIQAANRDQMLKDRVNSKEIGMANAATGALGDLASAMNDGLNDIVKYTPEAVAKLIKSIDEAATTMDTKTKGYVAMEKEYQQQRVKLETFALGHMNTYMEGVRKVNELMTAAITEMQNSAGYMQGIKDNWEQVLTGVSLLVPLVASLYTSVTSRRAKATADAAAAAAQAAALNDVKTPPAAGTAGAPGGSGPKGGGPAGGNRKQRRAAERKNKGRSGAAGAIASVLGGGAPDGSAANPYHVVMASGGPGISDLLDGGKNKGTPTKGTPIKTPSIGAKLISGLKGGIGGLVGGLALDYASDKAKEGGHEKTAAGLSVGSSALSGAGTGAMIGSIIPGLGTAVGGAVGGLLGGAYGMYKNWNGISGKSGGEAVGTSVGTGGATPTTQAATVAQLSAAQQLSSTQYAETLKAIDLTQPDLLINKSVAEQLKLAKAGNTMFTEQNKLLEKMAKSLEDQSDYLKNIRGNTA